MRSLLSQAVDLDDGKDSIVCIGQWIVSFENFIGCNLLTHLDLHYVEREKLSSPESNLFDDYQQNDRKMSAMKDVVHNSFFVNCTHRDLMTMTVEDEEKNGSAR